MANRILRARAFQYDADNGQISLASLCYWVEDFPIIPSVVDTAAQFVLSAIHSQVGFHMRGIMPPRVGILRWSMRVWDADALSTPESPMVSVWNVPTADCYGVYNVSGVDNVAARPKLNYTLTRDYGETPVGDYPVRAKSVKFFTAQEAFFAFPPLLSDSGVTEAQALRDALVAPVALESIPVLELPAANLYPVHCRFAYEDELLSSDPDATANDMLKGWWFIGGGSFSLVPRYDKKTQIQNAGLI